MNQPERRPVESLDPSLSDSANEMVTRELQDVVGSATVPRPAHPTEHRREAHAGASTGRAAIVEHRVELIIGALVVLVSVVLAYVAKDAGAWVLAPYLVLLVSLVFVFRMIVRLTSETEHVRPEVAAQLEAEGVTDPDRMFTEMLEDFVELGGDHEPGSILRPGNNAREDEAADNPAEAAVEQKTAMTPTAHVSHPSAPRAADDEEPREARG